MKGREMEKHLPYGLNLFSSGQNIDGNTVGVALVGTMCNRFSSFGVTQDGTRTLTSVATTAAHELGHIFNMEHDDGERVQCQIHKSFTFYQPSRESLLLFTVSMCHGGCV